MKFTFALTLFASVVSHPAFADELAGRWHWVVSTTDGLDIMIDRSTVIGADRRRAWSRLSQTGIEGSAVGLDEYDCVDRTRRQIAFRGYSPDRSQTSGKDYGETKAAEVVAPSTNGETMLSWVCADDEHRKAIDNEVVVRRDPDEAVGVARKLRGLGLENWIAAYLAAAPTDEEWAYWPKVQGWLSPQKWPAARAALGLSPHP